MALERRSFLLGALGGVAAGAASGLCAGLARPSEKHATPGVTEFGTASYAQQGEDLVLKNFFGYLQIPHPTYIDIGAHDPIWGNNTYLFYRTGSHGVLVEPNPDLTPKLRKVRPDDTVLEIGIGAKADDEEVDYYLIEGDGQLNTFSLARRDELRAGHAVFKGVIKRKLVNINKVLAQYFPTRAPDLFSTDTEGYDFTILSTLDFERFRPRVFCVETVQGYRIEQDIVDLLKSKDYELRGGSFVNTMFVDNRYVAELEKRAVAGDAGAVSPG
jgi:hypothetical protein